MKIVSNIEPLAHPIPEAARRSGHGETKFRQAIDAGEIGFIENGDRKLIEDEEIRRWLRSKRKYARPRPDLIDDASVSEDVG